MTQHTASPSTALPPRELLSWNDGEIPLFVRLPSNPVRGVLVSVHGNARQPIVHALRFADLAERHDLVLIAPSFARARHPRYQRLARDVDFVLTRTIDEVLHANGVEDRAWYWFGHSAGAQFVHRLVYRQPERVRRAALSAAGWYTLPDSALAYPYGLAEFQHRADMRRVLAVPQRVFVGAQDVHSGDALRREPALDEHQGCDRRTRARTFVRAMRASARAYGATPVVSLRELRGAGHDFDTNMRRTHLGSEVLRFLLREPTLPTLSTCSPPVTDGEELIDAAQTQ